MANFSVQDARAWAESSKLPVTTIDADLSVAVTEVVFAMLRPPFTTSAWTNEATTPKLIRTVLAMYYVAALHDKHYAQEEESSAYAVTLRQLADRNIAGLIAGNIEMDDYDSPTITSTPIFFPNDVSSATPADSDFPSNGGPAFTMGSIF